MYNLQGLFANPESSNVLIVAELSANHLHDFDLAVKTIKEMKKCGADAVKLQTYTADTITLNCSNDYFKINQGTVWDGKILYDLYKEAYTPWEWQPKLKKIAEEEEMILFSSPFDFTAVDFLEKMDVPAYKIASFEINDIPLIKYVASKGKPIILATGISEYKDIELAVKTCRDVGNNQIAILKCTSAYPAPYDEINLRTIPDIQKSFSVIGGLSDHTLGYVVPVAAVALGARIIEKHFILDRSLGGPDSGFSLEPNEFRQMVESVRTAETALGSINYELTDKTKSTKKFSRSLFFVKDVNKGDLITEENVRSIRPNDGLSPKYLYELLGKKVNRDVEKGTPLSWDIIGEKKR